jgi:deoxycytidylate deaminase
MGSTIYITRSPCIGCKQLILAERVARVVWFSPDNEICSETLFE